MAERVVVHVGLMKSGTTFIQGRLNQSQENMKAAGWITPNPRRRLDSVVDLIGAPHAKPGEWQAVVDAFESHQGNAILSQEYLAQRRSPVLQRLVDSFTTSRVEMVVTVRDLGRSVPAMWQESIKNRQTWSWQQYLAGIKAGGMRGGEAGKSFWRQMNAHDIVDRWTQLIGPERVTVVVVPPPSAPKELLWERFREAAGLPDIEWSDPPRANESLGAASALALRELNVLTQDWPDKKHRRKVKNLAKHVMVHRKSQEDAIGFKVPSWLHKRAEAQIKKINASGARVIGDLAELTPLDIPGVDPGAVSDRAQLEASLAALLGTLERLPAVKPQGAKKGAKK